MYRIISLYVLIFSGIVYAEQVPVELEISPSLLLKMVSNGQTTSILPEFEVFNSKGNSVFHRMAIIQEVLTENASINILWLKVEKDPTKIESITNDYL